MASGKIAEYHYAWRGGPKFWDSNSPHQKSGPEYLAALAALTEAPRAKGLTAPQMIDAYLDSAEYRRLAPRTRSDYRKFAIKFAIKFAAEFADDPATLFEDPASRAEVSEWRQLWAHSPKQYDYAGTVAVAILNWARDAGKIRQHHCDRMRKIYSSNRAEILWRRADIETFNRVAPEWVWRILAVAVETGLRPGDIIRLGWAHIEATPEGRRVRIRTNKTGRIASIPVT